MRTLIAIPCMDMIPTPFFKSILELDKEGSDIGLSISSLVYDARNKLCHDAVVGGYDRMLWLDSDMGFAPDLMQKLHATMDEGHDVVCGIFVKRKRPITPCIYKDVYRTDNPDGTFEPHADTFFDYPKEAVFPIAACGFGGVMVKVDLIATIKERYGLPFSPIEGFGEDLSFCMRARELGADMVCDSRIKLAHFGYTSYTEEDYLKGER